MDAHGKLYGISAGTGDPELITVKAWKAIRLADIVAYPAGNTIPQHIAGQVMQAHQHKLPLLLPSTASPTVLRTAWQTATINILQYLRQGKTVAFITEGDANFYSNFAYIVMAVKRKAPQVAIEVIPGVCAPSAAAAIAGIPLATGTDKLIVLPSLNSLTELEDAIGWAEVVVILDVSSIYAQVWQLLRRYHLLGCSHVVADQQLYWSDLTDHPCLHLPPCSVLIVSRVHTYSLLGY